MSKKVASQKPIGIVLGAAKIRAELVSVFGDIPSVLIPLNGKPSVYFILDHFKSLGIQKVYVSVGYKEEKVRRLLGAYPQEENFQVHAVSVDISKRPGSALLEVLSHIPAQEKKGRGVYLQLADTIPPTDFKQPFDKNFVVVSKDYSQSEQWCVVEAAPGGNIKKVFDKEAGHEDKQAAIGIYNFTDAALFARIPKRDCELSDLLIHLLKKKVPIKAASVKEWMDLGHLGKYYQAKARFLPTRNFNDLAADSFANTIVKKSSRDDILKDEINWYLDVPKRLSIYAPRVIDHSLTKGKMFAELEFYGYPSLSELWLYGELSEPVWQLMIDRLFAIVTEFQSYTHPVGMRDYSLMYEEKTKKRVIEARKTKLLAVLFDAPTLLINGVEQKGWPTFENKLSSIARKLYDRKDGAFLHGDLHFSNILFDLNHGVVKLVDPRGTWGSQSLYGDIKYDVAKLRHSVSGLYDHIIHDHMQVSVTPATKNSIPTLEVSYPLVNGINHFVQAYFDEKAGKLWDINKIKLIEALLFISMIPIHSDSEKRQTAMFARGITLLNELNDSGFI